MKGDGAFIALAIAVALLLCLPEFFLLYVAAGK